MSWCVPLCLFRICSAGVLCELTHWCGFLPELLGDTCGEQARLCRRDNAEFLWEKGWCVRVRGFLTQHPPLDRQKKRSSLWNRIYSPHPLNIHTSHKWSSELDYTAWLAVSCAWVVCLTYLYSTFVCQFLSVFCEVTVTFTFGHQINSILSHSGHFTTFVETLSMHFGDIESSTMGQMDRHPKKHNASSHGFHRRDKVWTRGFVMQLWDTVPCFQC